MKSLPIGKLRKYANAYDIRIDRAVEKEDIIDAIIAARVSVFLHLTKRHNFPVFFLVGPKRLPTAIPRGTLLSPLPIAAVLTIG